MVKWKDLTATEKQKTTKLLSEGMSALMISKEFCYVQSNVDRGERKGFKRPVKCWEGDTKEKVLKYQ